MGYRAGLSMWWARTFHHVYFWRLSENLGNHASGKTRLALHIAKYVFPYILLAVYVGSLIERRHAAVELQAPWQSALQILGVIAIALLIRETGRRRAVER